MIRTFPTLIPGSLLATAILVGATAHGDDFADQLPRLAATEPAETIKNFEIAEGYDIQLVASEPLVTSPVAIEWDADGALYVCEMRGYSENRDDRISRITKLLDVDRDGIYDSSVVFADHLFWPTALFPYQGGLFVADAPDILYFSDQDGDSIADSKEVIYTGFSTGNVQGLLNSFRWGLDNRIHLACGTVGGKVRRAGEAPSQAVEVRGHDLAFDPKSLRFTLTSGGAQHGMCFDDWGRKFVSSNSDHLQQVMYEDRYLARNRLLAAPPARQSIAADGPQAEVFRISPVEPWRVVRTRLRVAGLVPGPVEGGGRAAGYFTGATGVTLFRGDAWPDRDRSLALIGDVGSNLIHRKRLTLDGVQMVGRRIDERSEFVASSDNWFRPAQFACGPDGALSVVDVYREVIEHPKSLPPEIKRHLDLNSGRDRGRIYRVIPHGYTHRPSPQLTGRSSDELVELLRHPNAWHRETAARLIYQRQDKSIVPALRKQADQSSEPLARLHSLYAIEGTGMLTAGDVAKRFTDPHPQVVRHAIRLAEQFPSDETVLAGMRLLAGHPSIEVRYQLAFSLGEFSLAEKPQLLTELLRQNPTDRWIQTAVLSSIDGDADLLFRSLLHTESIDPLAPILESLAIQIDRRDDKDARRRSIAAISDAPDLPTLLPAIRRLHRPDRRDQVGPTLCESVDQKTTRLLPLAVAQLANPSADDDARILAMDWLVGAPIDQVFPVLEEILRTSHSSELQHAAIRAMGHFDSPDVAGTLLERWPQWSPRLRSTAGDVLFSNPTRAAAVIAAIDDGAIAASDISLTRWNALLTNGFEPLRKRARDFLATTKLTSRDSVIQRYQSALSLAGEAVRGEAVFKQQCAGCHRSGDQGHQIGPSLAAAVTRGAESILTNVLDPNREVNPQYVNYVVLTKDGRTAAGMIASENSNSITLKRAESVTETVLRGDIEMIRNTNQSIMPVGFEKAISPQAMADLIEYLVTDHETD
jgi:putative membrane-bound dehydrogenase-like protein